MITLGFHLLSRKPFFVASACFRLCAISDSVTVTPWPFHRYVLSVLYVKCSRSSGLYVLPSMVTL